MHNLDLRHFRSALAIFLPLLLLAPGTYGGQALEVGDQAPDWILANSRGEHLSFYQDSADQRAVLLFWATWCPYCAELMPELEKLRSELANENIKFYALNIWEDGDPIAHMQENDFGFTLLLEADKVAKRYNVRSTPGLFVVNANKTIDYIRGQGNSTEEVFKAVEAILRE